MFRKLFSLGAIAAVLLGLTGCAPRNTISGGINFNLGNSGEQDNGPEPKQQNPEPKTEPPQERYQSAEVIEVETSYLREGNVVDGVFFDDFSGYDGTFSQGQDFGPWTAVYDGDGFIRVEAYSNEGAWLELQPALPEVPETLAELVDEIKDSMSEEESRALTQAQLQKLIESRVTRAALVVGPDVIAPFVYRTVVSTDYQTKENPAEKFKTTDEALLNKLEPNPWEVAWVIWNYIPNPRGNFDKDSFNYFILKPNGWELGYRNSEGIQNDFATGDDVRLCTEGEEDCYGPDFRDPYEVVVRHDFFNAITVYVDGERVVRYKSDDNGVAFGKVGIYDEDAGISVAEAEVIKCGNNEPFCEDTIEELFPIE